MVERRAGTLLLALLLALPVAARAAPGGTAVVAPAAAGMPGPAAATGITALRQAISSFIARPRFASARWGIDVVDLTSGRTLYAHDAGKLFVPASNAKLFTAALAMNLLGPATRFTTTLYAGDHADGHGVVQGDLILAGGGDPALGTETGDTDGTDWADTLAARLVAAGITHVNGNLVVDDTLFRDPPFGDGWGAGDLFTDYAPQVGALTVREGTIRVSVSRDGPRCCSVAVQPESAGVRVRNLSVDATPGDDSSLLLYRPLGHDTLYVTGSLPRGVRMREYTLAAPDPARMAGQDLLDALARAGVTLSGRLRVLHWPQSGPLPRYSHRVRIATLHSPPLAQLLRHMLLRSDNLYAQTLLLQVGRYWQQSGAGSCGWVLHWTSQWGLCAMRTLLTRIGITREQAHFTEGSGLSRQDMVSPRATTTLLAWVARQPWAADLIDALPHSGHSGTLLYRLSELPQGDRVQAKTGTLAHMYTLSGFLEMQDGRRLAFSLMLNNYQRPIRPDGDWAPPDPTQDLDAIVRILAARGTTEMAATAADATPPASR